MSSERWHRISDLFQEALEHPAAERTAFLEARCPEDRSVRHEVEELLEADQATRLFLEKPSIRARGQGPEVN